MDEQIREMCSKLFGMLVAARQRLSDEQWEVVRDILNMRTGTHGAQMMATNAALMRELAEFSETPGSRRETPQPCPSRRRESGDDPADRGMWW